MPLAHSLGPTSNVPHGAQGPTGVPSAAVERYFPRRFVFFAPRRGFAFVGYISSAPDL